MPIETLEDIIEYFADQANIYGAHVEGELLQCRVCWTEGVEARILRAVEVKRKLAAPTPSDKDRITGLMHAIDAGMVDERNSKED